MTLFEPYSLGQSYISEPNFSHTLQIFVTQDTHFDSVYHTDYIEDAAFCQAIVYEILYKSVFKLPDVEYSVERMLHDPDGETIKLVTEPKAKRFRNYGNNAKKTGKDEPDAKPMVKKAVTEDGREFVFDDSGKRG